MTVMFEIPACSSAWMTLVTMFTRMNALISSTSTLLRRAPLATGPPCFDDEEDHGKDEERQHRGGEEAAHDDRGQRPLYLRSDAAGQEQRHEPENRDRRRHEHRAEPQQAPAPDDLV